MSGGYKTIGLRVEVYNKLKELANKSGKSFSDIIEELLDGSDYKQDYEVSKIREIVDEVLSEKMKDFETMLYNIVKKAFAEHAKKQDWQKSYFDTLREAFLGLREPVKMKKVPIQVSKANIFIEGINELGIDLSLFKARMIEEHNEQGEVIGLSIVPDIGFESMSLEEWFDEYGHKLLRKLIGKLSKS